MSARPLLVSERQKGNPLLKHLKNVPWKHDATITPDYVLGDRNYAEPPSTACSVPLSERNIQLNRGFL